MTKKNNAQATREERKTKREKEDLEKRTNHLFFNPIFPPSAPQNSWDAIKEREENHKLELSQIRTTKEEYVKKNKCFFIISKEEVLKEWLKNIKKEIIEKSQKENLAINISVAIKSYRDSDDFRPLTTDIVIEGLLSESSEIRDLSYKILESFITSTKPFGCTLWLKALNREKTDVFSLKFWELLIRYYPRAIDLGLNAIIFRDILSYIKRNPEVKIMWENAGINPVEEYSSKI